MANSDYRFVYTENDDGGVTIVVPSDKCELTLEQIRDKDCPNGQNSLYC